ncbi:MULTISPECIES: substrate-binding domain-containing protein [unclassified Streptomyces]|uniref:substrate-binding domain-containing protein n=1 Tax=unclassified Streptomyces TaxID=2593676 RepID=UPI0006FBC0EF|nr:MULTISPECIES: substrate-binding domain-containing protein [unclassified Streptomyces]KQX45524.1 phosphate ABC transporter substrate-binding protein [Streptomyces sp. Root1304]KRA79468.1 phosphate ABC transporter substrate-binding protein [Streptomyces sp. Root66D1]
MEWITAENVIAVGTALLGVLVSVGVVWVDRFSPQRKRLGFRVQLNTPLHREEHQDRGVMTVREGEVVGIVPPVNGSRLVLLRIENDAELTIGSEDYGPDTAPHGLKITFGERTVQGVVATIPAGWDSVRDDLERAPKLGRDGNAVLVPRVTLERGQYFKLLVQLSGGIADREVRIDGLTSGRVKRNRSTTPDEKPGRFSPTSRAVTVVLTLCVIALAAIIVRERTPPPIGCATGTLTVTGSTAFAPVVREVKKQYEKDCAGATIVLDPHGSTSGIRALADAGAKQGKGSPAVVALSDGRKPGGFPQLRENMVAVSLFTLVLNDDIPVDDLTLDQIRRVYRGEITNWSQLVPGVDRPVLLISRDANSGTREVFQRRVLERNEPANSSLDCVNVDDTEAKVIRCELDSTDRVLTTVAKLPGALGYADLRSVDGHKGLHKVAIDGREAALDQIGGPGYPYREIEYAYTWGVPPADSLTSSFLTYLTRGRGQDVIGTHGHLPCATPKGLKICGDG